VQVTRSLGRGCFKRPPPSCCSAVQVSKPIISGSIVKTRLYAPANYSDHNMFNLWQRVVATDANFLFGGAFAEKYGEAYAGAAAFRPPPGAHLFCGRQRPPHRHECQLSPSLSSPLAHARTPTHPSHAVFPVRSPAPPSLPARLHCWASRWRRVGGHSLLAPVSLPSTNPLNRARTGHICGSHNTTTRRSSDPLHQQASTGFNLDC
jgi:hypothetical protein